MSTLIVLLLVTVAVVYAVFFLFFKVIWLIFKKDRNKWPFILAGISTVLSGVLLACLIGWGISKIFHPFRPMQARIAQNPAPVYGLHTYTDPAYPFMLQLPDGVDYSEWITFPGVEIKLGINTNLFKKDAAGKDIKSPGIISALVRQSRDINREQPFARLEQELAKAQADRRFDLQEMHPETVDGQPAYYISGIVYSNRGPVPVWMRAILDGDAIVYVFASEISEGNGTTVAQELVQSLRPSQTDAPALE